MEPINICYLRRFVGLNTYDLRWVPFIEQLLIIGQLLTLSSLTLDVRPQRHGKDALLGAPGLILDGV